MAHRGPLSGLTIVELAGIGPGPMCSMMLGDMGADVIRIDRTKSARHGSPRRSQVRRAQPQPPLGLGRPAEEGRHRGRAAPDRQGRRHDRAVPSRRRRAPRPRPRRLPRAQSEAGLRPHDRLGPGRPARQGGRPRHQLHRADRRAARDRRQGQADAAAQPGRRLRRRRHAAGLRHGVRPAGSAELGQGPGGRCRDGRWRGAAAGRHLRHGGRRASGTTDARDGNMLDGGAHFYGTYETKDGKFVSIGSIEPQFYDLLLEKTGLKGETLPAQMDRKAWAQFKSRLEGVFKGKTRDEWCAIMEGTDICFAPVLTMKEASQHPHAKARNAYVDVQGFAAARRRAALLAHQGRRQGPRRQARPAHRRGAGPERLLLQGDRRAEGRRHRSARSERR